MSPIVMKSTLTFELYLFARVRTLCGTVLINSRRMHTIVHRSIALRIAVLNVVQALIDTACKVQRQLLSKCTLSNSLCMEKSTKNGKCAGKREESTRIASAPEVHLIEVDAIAQ